MQVVFHAPAPVGESGCTNPHVYAIEGRTSVACGFAPISHYQVLVDGGRSGTLTLDAGAVQAQATLDISGVFPKHDDKAHDQVAIDAQDVRPPLCAADAGPASLVQGAHVGQAAKRVIESGGSAAVWHSIRIISRTRRPDAARPFDGSSPPFPPPVSPPPPACARARAPRLLAGRADERPFVECRWRGDESEEILFTVPELSRPTIAVEHVSMLHLPPASSKARLPRAGGEAS
jgi:hypothetical protein